LNARIAAVAVLSAALVAGGATAANAAAPAKHAPAKHASAPAKHAPAKKHAPASSISISASTNRVRVGDSVTFSGSATGLSKGSTVTLQEQNAHGKWVSLDASTTVDRHSSYSVSDTLGMGKQTLRVVDGDTTSSSVTVIVK
jgi:plastocyanin